MHCMLGLFHVKLRTVWDIAEKIIKELFSSCSECREEFWLILCKKLESSYFKTLIIEDEENKYKDEQEDDDYKNNYWKNYESFEDNKGSNSNFLSLQQKQDEQEDEISRQNTYLLIQFLCS